MLLNQYDSKLESEKESNCSPKIVFLGIDF